MSKSVDEVSPAAQAQSEIDTKRCPNYGSELKIFAAILEAPVNEKILTHLGLQATAPPRAPASGLALQAACTRPNKSPFKRPRARAEGTGYA